MNSAGWLRLILQLYGVTLLLAIPAICLPFDWMDRIHQLLGMGELPRVPIVSYLARTTSTLFALFGAVTLMIATDVQRYWPFVRFWAIANIVLGCVSLAFDLWIPMPWWWTLAESPGLIALGLLVLWLQKSSEGVFATADDGADGNG